jgi:hypothetical protein
MQYIYIDGVYKMFKNVIYTICCAVALLSKMLMIENVAGMKSTIQTDEIVRITERTQFLAMSLEQAVDIKSISFNGVEIDSDFTSHFSQVMNHHIDSLIFDSCRLAMSSNYSGLIDYDQPIVDLAIVDCNIVFEDLKEVLLRISPYTVRRINLSNNGFMHDAKAFEQLLEDRVFGTMALDTLELRENGFSSDFIERITTKYSSSVQHFIF